MFYPEEISGEDLLTFVCSAEEAEKYELSYCIRTKDEHFPNEWIPIETGEYPEDEIKVQITYIGRNSCKPRCDAFAERYKGKWYWDDGDEIHLDVTPITAWRYSDDAFGLQKEVFMRIYMSGTISNGEAAAFLPQDLFFTSPECDDDLTPSENCIMLSAHLSECSTECALQRMSW